MTLLTQKELDDWAKDNNYDQQKVRMVNQALVKEGFIKSRKLNPSSTAPTNSYYWLGSKKEELKAKLEKTLEQYKARVIGKQKKIEKTREQLEEQK
jgi:hypothetical protein